MERLWSREGDSFTKLLQYCQNNALSININYLEPEDCYEIEIHSASKSENWYVKRIYHLEDVFDYYKQEMKHRGIKVE